MKLLILKPTAGKFQYGAFRGEITDVQNEELANAMIKAGYATKDLKQLEGDDGEKEMAKVQPRETAESKKASGKK